MRRASAIAIGLAVSLCGTAWAAAPAPSSVFLYVFPVAVDERLPEGQVELALSTEDTTFGELSARGMGHAKDGRLRVKLGGYPRSRDRASRRHSECSFLVDCNEPAVLAAADEAERALGKKGPVSELVDWVGKFIVKKSHSRGFDTASTTAKSREGDCSEHAVLLAALARHRGIPARVVTGLALVRVGEKPAGAFGHAWTEVYEGSGWHPADAALPVRDLEKAAGGERVTIDYLPVQVVEREDAGFHAGMLSGHGVTEITSVSVPKAPAARPADEKPE